MTTTAKRFKTDDEEKAIFSDKDELLECLSIFSFFPRGVVLSPFSFFPPLIPFLSLTFRHYPLQTRPADGGRDRQTDKRTDGQTRQAT